MPQSNRPRNGPLPRFAARVATLGPTDPLQLEKGDLQLIAEAVEKHPSTVQRAIDQKPGTRASAALIAGIEAAVGVPIARIRLMGLSGVGRKPKAAA